MVTKKRMKKYMRRMGQNTGRSKMLKKVSRMPRRKDLRTAYLQVGLQV
jgi:hypothetical protein